MTFARTLSRRDMLMLALFVAPVLASMGGGAVVAALAFPAAAFALAVWFAERDPARYVRLVLLCLILSPGLRHFVDWHIGFSQTNPIMLAPYLVVVAASPTVILYLITGRRYAIEFLVLMGVVLAALALSLGTGAVTDGLMAAMRWLSPPWLAIYICARADALPEVRDSVQRTFRIALPACALYGIVQFVAIAPWDAYFMTEAPINSIGFPEPFAVRVFGTMNSPGSLAAMLGTGTLLLLPSARGVRWVSILLSIVTLLLTTQRAAMGAFLVAVLILVLLGRDRALRHRIGKMTALVAVACALLLSVPGAAVKLTSTAESISALDQDGSAQERWRQYEDALPLLAEHELGRGLGWATNGLYVSVGDSVPLDSGFIDIFIGLGLPGGVLFLSMIAALALQGFRLCRRFPNGGATAEFAAVAFGLAQLPLGSQHTAEHGLFLYLAFGLLLARGVPVRLPGTLPRRAGRDRLDGLNVRSPHGQGSI